MISEFTKAGDLVVYLWARTFSTESVFMLLPKHRRFVGYDDDSAVVESFRPAVVLKYETQVCNDGSGIAPSNKVLSSASV